MAFLLCGEFRALVAQPVLYATFGNIIGIVVGLIFVVDAKLVHSAYL